MDMTYPPDGYDIDAYRDVHRSLFFLSVNESMRKQLIYSAAISIAARSRPWHENPSLRRIPGDAFKRQGTSGIPWSIHVYWDSNLTIPLPGGEYFPLLVSRSWTGAFGVAAIDLFSRCIIMKLSNGLSAQYGWWTDIGRRAKILPD